MTIRFELALANYLAVIRDHRNDTLQDADKVVVVRDLMGRLRLAMEKKPEHMEELLAQLQSESGPFFAEGVLERKSMLAPQAVFESPDAIDMGNNIWLLERVATGAEFGRGPLTSAMRIPRATLYGVKGGVGRSTALCVWARHLSQKGERVLVIDLDSESPGVSALLLPEDTRPDFGVVDWLVEEAVGNADADLLRLMVSRSPLAQGTEGDILVASCGGTRGDDYMPKLSRAYVDVPRPDGVFTFAERVAGMLDALEEEHRPTVVLLDSRAGLHDLAGIATTRLGATTFLFATASRQTWTAYCILLKNWAMRPAIAREVRQNLRVVAAQVPETERLPYLERLRLEAYDAFSGTLYEEAAAEDADAFNFDIPDEDAPHCPLNIYWSRAFQDWDPSHSAVTDDQLRAAFGEFVDKATEVVLASGEE